MLTSSEIIYNSWLNTPHPLSYETADAKGNKLTKNVSFADPLQLNGYDDNCEGECNLCGQHFKGGIPVKKLLGSSYMDWAIHKNPAGTHICKSCAFCAAMNPEGRIALFRYAIIADGKALHLYNRAQMRDALINPPEPPFVAIVPVSQKKHLFGKSKISYSRDDFFCNLEEQTVLVNHAKFVDLIGKIEALRGVGVVKTDIEAGRIGGVFIKNYDAQSQERALEVIEECRRTEMFQLALFLAQKKEEVEAICYLGFKPKTK